MKKSFFHDLKAYKSAWAFCENGNEFPRVVTEGPEKCTLQNLKDELFWILCNSWIGKILFLANNELLNQDPINEIAVRVLKIKNVYTDKRWNNVKRNESTYFTVLNFFLLILYLVT